MAEENSYSIQYARDKSLIMNFIGTHWKKDHILAKNEELFDWQYQDKNKDRYNFLYAGTENEVIGVLGFIPNTQFDEKKTAKIIWLALWKVIEDKYPGLGLRMLFKLFSEFPESVIAVNGIDKQVLDIYSRLDFKVNSLKHYYIVNSLHPTKLIKNPKYGTMKYKKAKDYTLERISEDDLLNDQSILPNIFGQYKSYVYIINRYIKHPFYRYKIFSLNSKNNVISLLIVREININDEKVFRVVDFFGEQWTIELLPPLLQALIDKEGASYIDFLVGGIKKDRFLSGGFQQSDQKNTVVPNYFEPFSMEPSLIHTAWKSSKEEDLRIFKGDGDQDRPNFI